MLNVIPDQKSYNNNFCSDWWSFQHNWSDKLARNLRGSYV